MSKIFKLRKFEQNKLINIVPVCQYSNNLSIKIYDQFNYKPLLTNIEGIGYWNIFPFKLVFYGKTIPFTISQYANKKNNLMNNINLSYLNLHEKNINYIPTINNCLKIKQNNIIWVHPLFK
jgi:hypothetical protein